MSKLDHWNQNKLVTDPHGQNFPMKPLWNPSDQARSQAALQIKVDCRAGHSPGCGELVPGLVRTVVLVLELEI